MQIMRDLFSEESYLSYKFPEPQYLGAKYILRGWIAKYVPEDANVVLDAFSGSQSIAYLMKQMGKQTLTNDFLSFNSHIGKALIENPGVIIDKGDIKLLLSENSNPEKFNLMETLFADLFFTHEEASFLDSFRSNVEL